MDKVVDLFTFCENDDVISLKNSVINLHDINEKEPSKGWTLLSVAAFNHSLNCVEFLLSNGADINSINNNGTTILMYAKTKVKLNQNFKFLDYLIERGADLNMCDIFGKNIYDYVLESNDILLINYFKTKMKTGQHDQ
jgi:ankyrin repeat protein